jgi:hypothetical protein
MMGYSAQKIEIKAAKRGMEPMEYELYLIQKRSERSARKQARKNPPPVVDTPVEA